MEPSTLDLSTKSNRPKPGRLVLGENEREHHEMMLIDELLMALSAADKEWISKEISGQTEKLRAELRPAPATRLMFWLKGWSAIAVLWSVPLALLAACITLAIATFNRRDAESKFEGKSEQRLTDLEGDLKEIKASVASLKLSVASLQPLNKGSLGQIKATLESAKKHQQILDPSTVRQVGLKLLDVAQLPGDVWQTANLLVSYSTADRINPFPNASPVPISSERPPGYWTLDNAGPVVPVGKTFSSDRAELYLIGLADPNKGLKWGNVSVQIRGGEVDLYLMHMKHVVVFGAKVVYHGGPVSLDDVTFVNCTFDFGDPSKTRPLATAILEQPRTSYHQSAEG